MTNYEHRLQRLNKLLADQDLDGLILNPGPSLFYLSGLQFHLMERPILFILIKDSIPLIILPYLERTKLSQLSFQIRTFTYKDDPATWQDSFNQAFKSIGSTIKRFAVEPARLRYLELRYIQRALPSIEIESGELILSELRSRKDDEEIMAMRKAAEIAEKALINTLPIIKPGITERQVAAQLSSQLLLAGSDPETPFAPIVASGPNSANPHATPTDRIIQAGDLLIIDWGARYKGYCSDITRTFAIETLSEQNKKIAEIVLLANRAAREVATAGITAGRIDQAARQVITDAGYGEYFTHRTGHGLGLEGHEYPYIYGTNDQSLEPGHAFTIEPGIYIPGQGGVRIEDDVVVTEDGIECLTGLPREIQIL